MCPRESRVLPVHGVLLILALVMPPLSCFTCTAGKEGKFALDCAVGSLDLYDEFFGLEYPLVKLDMIAIPEFAAGAMENWYAGNPPA